MRLETTAVLGAAMLALSAAAAPEVRPCAKITFKEMPSLMLYGDPTPLGPERPFAKDPTVIRHNGKYFMYYSVCASTSGKARPRKGWGGAIAESTDLVHWKRVGELKAGGLDVPGQMEMWVAPCVKKIDGKIHMFAQGRVWRYADRRNECLIWHATSEDGVNFTFTEPRPMFVPQNKWSIERAIDAEVYRVGDRLMLMYATREKPDAKFQRLGIAWAPYASDWAADKWTELSIEKAFFEPELPWEMSCIEAPTVVERKGVWYMFYAGAYNHERQQIGVAWSKDGVNFVRGLEGPVFPHGKPGSWNAWESGHPGLFKDDDGRIYLFYQGKATHGGDYRLSCVEVVFED